MSSGTDWKTDWNTFVTRLIELIDSGASESDVSERFHGSDVHWRGDITDVKINEEFAPGISLAMGTVRAPMANDLFFNANHLFLPVPPDMADSWKNCSVGDSVDFTATIPINEGPRPAIKWVKARTKPEIGLRMQLINCKRVSGCA